MNLKNSEMSNTLQLFGSKKEKEETIESLGKKVKIWRGVSIGLGVGLVVAIAWVLMRD